LLIDFVFKKVVIVGGIYFVQIMNLGWKTSSNQIWNI